MKFGRTNFPYWRNKKTLEAFLGGHDDLWNAPSPSHQPHRNILLSLAAIQTHVDWVEDYMSHMESSCRKIYAHEQWKAVEQSNCQEELMRKTSCIKWSWWRKYTVWWILLPYDQWQRVEPLEVFTWNFGWSVSTLSDWMMRHLFIFPACICGDNYDASYYCD